jgi:hypothetical protein
MPIAINGTNYKSEYLISNGVNVYSNRSFLYQTELIFYRAIQEDFITPSLITKIAIDYHIRNMVNSGTWDKLDTYTNFAYNNLSLNNFSRIDWKNPLGLLLNSFGGVVYTEKGFEGNSVDAYIINRFNTTGATNWKLNSASFGSVIYKSDTTAPYFIAQYNGSSNRTLLGSGTGNMGRINQSAVVGTPAQNLTGDGLKALSRSAASNYLAVNKDVTSTINATSTSVENSPFYLLRITGNSFTYTSAGISNFFAGASLTSAEIQNLRNDYNIFLLTIGLTQFA